MVTSGNFASQITPGSVTPATEHQRWIPKPAGLGQVTQGWGGAWSKGRGLSCSQAELLLKARSTRRRGCRVEQHYPVQVWAEDCAFPAHHPAFTRCRHPNPCRPSPGTIRGHAAPGLRRPHGKTCDPRDDGAWRTSVRCARRRRRRGTVMRVAARALALLQIWRPVLYTCGSRRAARSATCWPSPPPAWRSQPRAPSSSAAAAGPPPRPSRAPRFSSAAWRAYTRSRGCATGACARCGRASLLGPHRVRRPAIRPPVSVYLRMYRASPSYFQRTHWIHDNLVTSLRTSVLVLRPLLRCRRPRGAWGNLLLKKAPLSGLSLSQRLRMRTELPENSRL